MNTPLVNGPASPSLHTFFTAKFPQVKLTMETHVAAQRVVASRRRKGEPVQEAWESAKAGFPRSAAWLTKQQAKHLKTDFKHSVFYLAEGYVGRPSLVSGGAAKFFSDAGVPNAGWRLTREEQGHFDRGPRQGKKDDLEKSGAKLIHEHVWTGEMAWEACLQLYVEGNLSVDSLVELFHTNFCTAWVLRSENKALNKSKRGKDITSALAHYRSRGVSLYRENDPNVVNP